MESKDSAPRDPMPETDDSVSTEDTSAKNTAKPAEEDQYERSARLRIQHVSLPKGRDGSSLDLYQLLGCTSEATAEQLQAEFQSLARKLHPDKQPLTDTTKTSTTSPEALSEQHTSHVESNDRDFATIQQAYNILKDPTLRRLYDQWRASGLQVPFEDWVKIGQESFHFAASSLSKRKQIAAYEHSASDQTPKTKEAKTDSDSNPSSSFSRRPWAAGKRQLPWCLMLPFSLTVSF